MNQVAIREPQQPQQKLMLLDYMADRYSLKPDEFSRTVRATCGLSTATPEQVAAFLIVAKEYDLNPLTKEIYAFPGRGGGIVPIVSIDGWVNLVNSHPKCDGFDFTVENVAGELFSITCTMHRKDRGHPTVVTEYLSECIRSTEPWKMKHRMLRHKSFIQAARYAFGFAGIYDEDEGRTIAEAVDVTPRPRIPSPSEVEDHGSDKYRPGDVVDVNGTATPATVDEAIEQRMEDARKDDPISIGLPPKRSAAPDIDADYDGWFSWCLDKLRHAESAEACDCFFEENIDPVWDKIFPGDAEELAGAQRRTQEKFAS